MAFEVLCIGNACYDIISPLEAFPGENQKIETRIFYESGGGPASNAAYLLSKWGVKCAFAGLAGNDVYGRKILEEFQSAGTDISQLEIRENHSTSLSIILVNKHTGSRTVINRKFAEAAVSLDLSSLPSVNPSIILMDGHELEASITAMRMFPGAVTILDAGSLRKGTEILSREVDYLVASERFALSVTGLSELDSNWQYSTDCLKKLNGKNVVITLGEKGAIYDDHGTCRHFPAFPVQAVDTTAAGDIFHGAFTFGILNKMELKDTIGFASRAAALSVLKPGGRQSIPLLEEVMNY